jgi:hypothetical protein
LRENPVNDRLISAHKECRLIDSIQLTYFDLNESEKINNSLIEPVLQVIVFNSQDYPDVSSGGVTEILVFPASETYIDINPISFSSMPIIKNVSPKKRNCVFSTEVPMHDGTSYTYSDCIVSCKLHDMQHICGCRPFFYPRRGKHECQ